MGWKSLKEAFGIKHIVAVNEKGVCIGSPYVHNLVVIDPETGEMRENPAFSNLVRETYPQLWKATPGEILRQLAKPDVFASSIPVYTYEDGVILEKMCEEPGWPNVTHDGCIMHENTYSTDKDKVVAWAKRDLAIKIESTQSDILQREQELERRRARMSEVLAKQAGLEENYPVVVPAD